MSTRSLLVSVGLMLGMLGALSFLQKQVPGTERMAKESRRITDMPVREADRIELKVPKGEFVFRKKRGRRVAAGEADSGSGGWNGGGATPFGDSICGKFANVTVRKKG